VKKHVIIAAGGSGGHVLPAQVVAQDLQDKGVTTAFAALGLDGNPFFERSRWPFHDIASAPPSLSFNFLTSTTKGIAQAVRILRQERPSLVIGFGSYHVFPVLTAASLLRIPTILYAADSIPGRAIRLFAPFARWTGCFFEEAVLQLRGMAYHVDFPLRVAMRSPPTRQEGCQHFGLEHHSTVVLVLGGSQGAHALNDLVPVAFAKLPLHPTVIHLAGRTADINAISAIYRQLNIKASIHAYEHAMHCAYAAADVVIARSGASSIAEIEACHKPAIYIPYPRAMDDHQKKNALLAAARGRAVVIDEVDATPDAIAHSIQCLLEPCLQKCEYQRKSPLTFVTKILQTLDEVSQCQRR
jgi:UDP-N-acetylglucosamine--N-acetylmuramyl-(pentapeptide) pyrophosphoryl-undecaprenol N-acetylglucosamine transferase